MGKTGARVRHSNNILRINSKLLQSQNEQTQRQNCTKFLLQLTFHSKPPTAIPLAAPVPARPTKCPLPMLLANRDAPTLNITLEQSCRTYIV